MSWLKGPKRSGAVVIGTPVDFEGRIRLPGEFDRKTFYVDANNGSASNGGSSWSDAKATIQAAVDLANANEYRLNNVDIYVANGNYEETVEIKWAALGMTTAQNEAALVWQNMGSNCGNLGTLRIIGGGGVTGAGYNKWTCGAAATQPCLYIGRPNVEVHGFNFQENSDVSTAAGVWGDGDEMAGHSQIAMPCIVAEDQYNIEAAAPTQVLANGAGNNVLIKNCRLNSGGVLNSGAKWVHVEDCLLEYCGYGVAMIANSKGRASESHVWNCSFTFCTYDIVHGYAIVCSVDKCRFLTTTSTTSHLFPLAAHAASTLCVMSNCQGMTETLLGESVAKNSGWSAYNCSTTDAARVATIPAMSSAFQT